MVELNQIYKCNVCGNIVEVVHASVGTLVCCGQPMELLHPKDISQEGNEKHVPIIKKLKTKIRVRVGSKPHPMEEKHHIEFIELVVNGKVYREYLKPGQVPYAEFCDMGEHVHARIYCNVHGLWKS